MNIRQKNPGFSNLNFIFISFSLVVICSLNTLLVEANESTLSPVILIPGDGGNQLEARWNKSEVIHYLCSKKADWNTLWLDIYELITPHAVDCFVDNMRLVYDNKTKETSNSPGVEVRIPGFGETTPVEYLDPSRFAHTFSQYFVAIVDQLLRLGYEKNKSIRGAPYDFRKAPNELGEYYLNLTKLIEETHKANGQKVTLIAHSLGAPVLHYFFIHKSQAWKNKHIESIMTLSGAWGGAVKPLKVYAVGDNLGSKWISSSNVKRLQRSMASLAFLMPSMNIWHEEEVLVETPKANYSLSNVSEYFKVIPFEDGYEMYKNTKDMLYKAPPPGVEVHCLHGVGVPTTERVVFKENENFSKQPTLVKGDGDGTVNTRSLQYCLQFQGKQKQEIHYKTFDSIEHLTILWSYPAIQYITTHLENVNQKNQKNRLLKRKKLFLRHGNYRNSIHSLNSIN